MAFTDVDRLVFARLIHRDSNAPRASKGLGYYLPSRCGNRPGDYDSQAVTRAARSISATTALAVGIATTRRNQTTASAALRRPN
jgi:hypothetical protein